MGHALCSPLVRRDCRRRRQNVGQTFVKRYPGVVCRDLVGVKQIPVDEKEKTAVKVIVTGKDEKVLGIHVIGMGADEMMQGFGVAMKVG